MLQFPYLPVPLVGAPPPSLPTGTQVRWRPFVPVRILGLAGRSRSFTRALVDPGSDETIFPLAIVRGLGITLAADTGHRLRWRGQTYPLRFGPVEVELTDNGTSLRWPATVAFTAAPIPYRLLGYAGCLQFLDATFRGDERLLALTPNRSYPGTMA